MKTEWTPEITVLNLAEKRISIVATRTVTDDSDPDPLLWTLVSKWKSMPVRGIITTAQQKLAMMADIWGQWQKYLTNQNDINTLLDTLEADAKANLEARE